MGQQEAADCGLLPPVPACSLASSTAPAISHLSEDTIPPDEALFSSSLLLLLPPCLCVTSCYPVFAPGQIHARWVNLWARRVMASPEQALVPLKERDALLASKHEVRTNPVLMTTDA